MTKVRNMVKGVELDDQVKIITQDRDRLTSFWRLRDLQMEEDRKIINLIPPEKIPTDMKYWPTSEPKSFFDTSRSLISLYPPRFRLPLPINYDEDQKRKMNKAERLCLGIYRALDNHVAEQGGVSWLYDLAYWVLQGWYSVFAIVRKGEEGVDFTADIWDPINVYPEWDKDGLVRLIRTYTVDESTSEAMALEFQTKGLEFDYKKPDEGQPFTVTNYWRRQRKSVFNAIMLNGVLAKPLTLQRNLRKIPVHVGAIGSPDRVTPNWQSRKGESIIAAARKNYEFKTQIRSLRAEITDQTAFPNIVTKTLTGRPAVAAEDVRGHGSVIPLKLQDMLEILKHAATPQDALVLEQDINAELQRSTLPSIVYGGIGVELSGFAISQLMAAIKYKLGPYLNTMQFVVGRILTDLLCQYKAGKFEGITLSTTNPYDLKRGMTYIEEFTGDDVPERTYVEVNIPISSQFDKTQAILNSVQALQAGLESRETLWETELGIEDSDQEKQRIAEDRLENDPFIRQIEIIERLWIRVQSYREQAADTSSPEEKAKYLALAMAMENYVRQLEAQIGAQRGGANAQGSQPAMPGIPPSQMPPEMMNNPDMIGAMAGQPPPGVARQPQTPEQREANKGRRGILVAPTGESLA